MATSARKETNSSRSGSLRETTTPRDLELIPLSHRLAKQIVEREHYLNSLPGGTELCFGVLAANRLQGVITFGAGPANAYRMVEGAGLEDCLALTRVWLSDDLPKNSESRVIGQALRVLRRSTDLKFLVTYADPEHGHVGTIYQATNWTYTGLSGATPMFDLGDGVARHSRSVSHSLGTHNTTFLLKQGIELKKIVQRPKHRYVFFLDRRWRTRLLKPVLPYPKQEVPDAAA